MGRTSMIVLVAALCATTSGCASWDSMNSRQKSAVVGAGVGGVLGAAVSGGGVLSTVGGAAIGGVIGDQASKRR